MFFPVKKKYHFYLVSEEYIPNEQGINLSFTGRCLVDYKIDDCTKAVGYNIKF